MSRAWKVLSTALLMALLSVAASNAYAQPDEEWFWPPFRFGDDEVSIQWDVGDRSWIRLNAKDENGDNTVGWIQPCDGDWLATMNFITIQNPWQGKSGQYRFRLKVYEQPWYSSTLTAVWSNNWSSGTQFFQQDPAFILGTSAGPFTIQPFHSYFVLVEIERNFVGSLVWNSLSRKGYYSPSIHVGPCENFRINEEGDIDCGLGFEINDQNHSPQLIAAGYAHQFYETDFDIIAGPLTVNGNEQLHLDAGNKVVLLQGFKALAGSDFIAIHDGCGGAFGKATNAEPASREVGAAPMGEAIPQGYLQNLRMYPNPSSGQVWIDVDGELPDDVEAHVQVFAIDGRMVHATRLTQSRQQLDLSALDAGTYIVRVSTPNEQQTLRIVRQ